jgi:hypothetical protein
LHVNWNISLGDLLQGTASAVIGLVGAVLAAYLLIRHERQLRANSADESRADAERAELRAATGKLVAAASGLVLELMRPQILVGAARIRLIEAMGPFVAVAWAEHRPVAEWVQFVAQEAIQLATRTTRYWLLPGMRHRKEQAAASMGAILAVLPSWAEGNITDSWFQEDLMTRRGSKAS